MRSLVASLVYKTFLYFVFVIAVWLLATSIVLDIKKGD